VSPKHIVSKHVSESVENLISNLRGKGRKRVACDASVTKKRKKGKRAKGTSDLLQSLVIMSGAEFAVDCSVIVIFLHRTNQTAVLGTVETVYKPIGPEEQNDLEFWIAGDYDTYIDLDIKIYVRGKLAWGS